MRRSNFHWFTKEVRHVTIAFDWDDRTKPILLYSPSEENTERVDAWMAALKSRAVAADRKVRTWGAEAWKGGTRCAYCLHPTDKPERDHIVPFSAGGTESYDNIVPACRSCNAKKHDMSLLQFVAAGGIS